MRRLIIFVLSFAVYACLPLPTEAADAPVDRVDQLKAAYVFNFMKFVQWQALAPTDVLTVCFVGAPGVYAVFANGIGEKRAGTHQLAARSLNPADQVEGCQALYIEASAVQSVAAARGSDLPILTVSDAKAFASSGGIIELFAAGNRLQFNINIANAQRAGLLISSSLLQLAAVVDKERS